MNMVHGSAGISQVSLFLGYHEVRDEIHLVARISFYLLPVDRLIRPTV